MTMRIATFSQTNQMVASALRTESTMASMQIQEASGIKSSYLAGYGADTQHIVNLQVSVTRAQSYIDAGTLGESKTEVLYSSVGQISDVLSQLRSQLSAATAGSSNATSSAISTAQQLLQQMGSILNTQYDGQYIFAGAKNTTPAVDLSTFSSGAGDLSTSNTSYYQGDNQISSVRVSDSQTVNYGVTANDPAIEQVMRVLKYVANSSSLSSSDITSALSVVDTATDAVAAVQAKVSSSASQITTAMNAQSEFQSYAKSLNTDLSSVDVAAITAQLSTYQAQLTASYTAMGKVQSMLLANYLK